MKTDVKDGQNFCWHISTLSVGIWKQISNSIIVIRILYFFRVLDLQENCEDSAEFLFTHTQFPILNIFGVTMVHLFQLMNWYQYIINSSPYFIHISLFSPSALLYSVFASRVPPYLWQFLRLYFWWSWQLWRILVKYFVGCPSLGICLIFFSWLDHCQWSFGRRTTEVKCHFYYIISTVHIISMTYHCGYWPWSLGIKRYQEIMFFRFFHHEVIHLVPPPNNSSLILWKEVTISSLLLRSGEL